METGADHRIIGNWRETRVTSEGRQIVIVQEERDVSNSGLFATELRWLSGRASVKRTRPFTKGDVS